MLRRMLTQMPLKSYMKIAVLVFFIHYLFCLKLSRIALAFFSDGLDYFCSLLFVLCAVHMCAVIDLARGLR